MAPTAASASSSSFKGRWRPTKIMNMRDLSRDDDFLSHLLVEKLGTGDVPLVVHKMDPSRRLPKTNAEELLQIVRRMVATKGSQINVIRQAVDDLLSFNAVKYYLQSSSYDQKQVNAFATHASRYFELYLPGGSIEISHTSRYAHRTGKSELCILATRPLAPGTVITELKGSMADLTEEEDKELKRTDEAHADGVAIRRDFSVIHSKQLKKNHLFLGPARFVNHDCDHNAELFREGRYITFRVIRTIGVGEEVTAHYGDGYFGRRNKHCLCATCERKGRGGYAPEVSEDELSDTGSGSGADVEADRNGIQSSESEDERSADEVVNFNERRTRRGVYTVVPEAAKLRQVEDGDVTSDLSSPPPSSSISAALPNGNGLLTPEPEAERGRPEGKAREAFSSPVAPIPVKATSSVSSTSVTFKSVISTRAQKAREVSASASTSRAPSQCAVGRSISASRSVSAARQLVTPPLTVDSTTGSVRSSSRLKSREEGREDISRVSTPMKDRKGKGRATTSVSDVRDIEKDEPETRHLRPRVTAPIFDQTLSRAKKILDAPRGLDGKPLPLCATCGNVLPVISVNSEVVWGLSLGRTGKRGRPKKEQVMECPRCIRHFAIYERKWPERLNGDGNRPALAPTREDTFPKKLGNFAIASNRNLAIPVISIPGKRSYASLDDGSEVEISHPPKKHKGPTGRPRGRPPKNKVGMSDAAKELLNVDSAAVSRSGRTRVPSMKMRESEPPHKTRVSPRKLNSDSTLSALSTSPEVTRHHTPIPHENRMLDSPQPAKVITPKSLAVAAQPRDSNGRFGKKAETNGRFMRSRHFPGGSKRLCKGPKTIFLTRRTAETYDDAENRSDRSDDEDFQRIRRTPDELTDLPSSDSLESAEIGEEALEDVVRRRSSDSEHHDDPHGKRKRSFSDEEESDTSPTTSPRIVLGRGRGSLLRPNPISFARRKWAACEDDDKLSLQVTVKNRTATVAGESLLTCVEDNFRHEELLLPAHTISVPQESDSDTETSARDDSDQSITDTSPLSSRPLVVKASMARLTFRPSPMNLAKRRWAPPQKSRMSESIGVESVDEAAPRSPEAVKRFTSIKPEAAKIALAGTELDDNFPFGDLVYPSDVEFSGSEEDYAKVEPDPPRLRPVAPESLRDLGWDRQRSPDVVVADSYTDDSEQMVERLISIGSASRRPPTRSPSPLPSVIRRNPDSPPGYEWKKTVLMPSPKSTLRDRLNSVIAKATIVSLNVAAEAGSSSRLAGANILPMKRPPTALSHSPSPLMTPPPIRQLVCTGWNAQSDSESL
ncbi:hypothetical protein BC835DRAFT_1310124 [Cytidiella melzeri]|nr:hypothetical protein BC835DRAFT_1310124 [Cytidiella melzeri]